MRTKAIGMFAVLLMALSVLGFAYAYWNETLTIHGDITTGVLDVEFTMQKTNDPKTDGSADPNVCGSWDYETKEWTGDRYELDVASIDCVLVKDEDFGSPEFGDYQKIEITVLNAYPSYYGSVMFTIDNIGSIPAKIMSIKLVEISKDSAETIVSVDLDACTTYYVDFETSTVDTTLDPAVDDFSLHLSTLAVGQVVPLSGSIPGDLTVHIEEGAAEKTNYDFTIKIGVGQFNA